MSWTGLDDEALSVKLSLTESLRKKKVKNLYVGGLATDYCVKATVLDALKEGFKVTVLIDAIRGVDVKSGDSINALKEMEKKGAETTMLKDLAI